MGNAIVLVTGDRLPACCSFADTISLRLIDHSYTVNYIILDIYTRD